MSGLTPTGFVAETTEEVIEGIEADELAGIDAAINLAVTQPLGQINGIFGAAQSNLWMLIAAIYAAFDPDSAIGVQLDCLAALAGITRFPAYGTIVSCTINLAGGNAYAGAVTSGPAGKLKVVTPGALIANIAGFPQYTFTNRDAIPSSASGNVTAVFIAIQTGPIPVNTGTLTVITTPVTGWNSITNPGNGTLGSDIETDAALRLRREQSLVANGSSTIDSIRTTLLKIANVLQCVVLENVSLITDINGIPGKAFLALIWDGSPPLAVNAEIGQAIWDTKPSGIQAYGATNVSVVDGTGAAQSVAFTRATAVPIYFAITVRGVAGFAAAGGAAQIKAAIVALGAAIQIGGTVIKVAFEAASFSVSGVIDITSFTLGTAPAPVGTVNIPITATSIATFDAANVAVTIL